MFVVCTITTLVRVRGDRERGEGRGERGEVMGWGEEDGEVRCKSESKIVRSIDINRVDTSMSRERWMKETSRLQRNKYQEKLRVFPTEMPKRYEKKN